LWRAFRDLAVWFAVKIRLINPIGLSKNSPSIGASLFSLELSSLRMRRSSCLGRRRARV
jgi:hypothetical protein